MSGTLNRVSLIGFLGADPEAKSFQTGGRVVNLSLATTEDWKNRDGEKQSRTEWHKIVIFNEELGKIAEKYLRKGSKVMVEGQLESRKYTDRDNVDRTVTEIVLRPFNSMLKLLDSKPEDEPERPRARAASSKTAAAPAPK